MKRKDFLIHSTHVGLGCAASSLDEAALWKIRCDPPGECSTHALSRENPRGQEGIQRILSQSDAQIDEASRKSWPVVAMPASPVPMVKGPHQPPTPEAVENFLHGVR